MSDRSFDDMSPEEQDVVIQKIKREGYRQQRMRREEITPEPPGLNRKERRSMRAQKRRDRA